jgi:DNA polymerase-3 subunit epsilon
MDIQMREIVLDTETTGLNPRGGDRLIEIGCVELINRYPTGREYHVFINPERDVPAEAQAVHGIATEFLLDKPLFSALADEFLAFIADAHLVIHNASFDIGFLNFELERVGKPALTMDRVTDTLALARRKHPSGPNSLDALCKRYGVDNTMRVKHGALMDSVLLAEVYLELLGERQGALTLGSASAASVAISGQVGRAAQRPTPLPSRLTQEDEAAHAAFVATLGSNAIWLQYLPVPVEPAS